MKYAYIMIITNIMVKMKKTLQTKITVNGHDTKLCWSNKDSVIQIIHQNVGLKCFSFTQIFVIIVSFCLHLYFTR